MSVGLVAALPGCSFIFVRPPPRHTEQLPATADIECTTSDVAPGIDTVLVGLIVLGFGAVSVSDSSRTAALAPGIGYGALHGVSAVYGFAAIGKCADARAQQDQRLLKEVRRERRQALERARQERAAKASAPPPSATAPLNDPLPSAPAAPTRACVPGTTQECVGRGACKGGKACRSDGSAYTPCDCGDAAEPSSED